MVIGGFTQPKGSRQKFGALLLGIYSEKGLQYIGRVGTGFDEKMLNKLDALMQPLIQKKCPFSTVPKTHTIATWITPKLVCEISFVEWTSDHKVRQPVFHGLRQDAEENAES